MEKISKSKINTEKKFIYKPGTLLLLLGMIIFLQSGCSEVTAPEDISPPATPSSFTLIGGGDGQVHFRWTRNIEIDFNVYRIYRSVNNINSFSKLVELNQVEYVDRFLDYNTTYYYYIAAVDKKGNESKPSNIIDVQPLNISAPQPPTNAVAQGVNNPIQSTIEIRVSWTPPDIGDLKNYLIYRGTDSLFTATAASYIDSTNIALYVDKSVQLNKKYYYKIVAVDKGMKKSLPSISGGDLILSSPSLITPANNTRFGNPKTFKWSEVNSAVHYQVFVGSGPFSGVIWSSNKTNKTELPYGGPALTPSKVYYWWVVAFSRNKIVIENKTELQAQANSFSLINTFFSE